MPPESSRTIVSARGAAGWRCSSARSTAAARSARGHAVQAREHREDLPAGQLDVEVVELRHHPHLQPRLLGFARQLVAEHRDLALVGERLRGEHPHRRRLARAVGAEQPEAHARRGTSRSSPFDGHDRAVALDHAAQRDRRRRRTRGRSLIVLARRQAIARHSRSRAPATRPGWPRVDRRRWESRTAVHSSRQRGARAGCSRLRSGAARAGDERMATRPPQIVALGGGGFSMEKDGSLLDDYVLSLTDAPRPRVCFLPTASGDADHYVVRFYRRFSADCDASHVSLFRRDQGTGGVEDDLATPPARAGPDLRGRRQRREHARRVARARARRRSCARRGAGASCCAGPRRARCAGSSRRSAPSTARPRSIRGLGLLPYSNCVHYDAEPARRAEYHRFVGRRHARRASRSTTASRCTSAARASSAVVSSRARRPRLPRRAAGGRPASRRRSRPASERARRLGTPRPRARAAWRA